MKHAVLALLALSLAACATVQHGPVQRIRVDSEPAGVYVYTDQCGPGSTKEVRTPGVVWVSRRAQRCKLTFTSPGYEIEEVALTRSVSEEFLENSELFQVCAEDIVDCTEGRWFLLGWAIAGTGFGVDAITGALYEQHPGEVFVTLREYEAAEPDP